MSLKIRMIIELDSKWDQFWLIKVEVSLVKERSNWKNSRFLGVSSLNLLAITICVKSITFSSLFLEFTMEMNTATVFLLDLLMVSNFPP